MLSDDVTKLYVHTIQIGPIKINVSFIISPHRYFQFLSLLYCLSLSSSLLPSFALSSSLDSLHRTSSTLHSPSPSIPLTLPVSYYSSQPLSHFHYSLTLRPPSLHTFQHAVPLMLSGGVHRHRVRHCWVGAGPRPRPKGSSLLSVSSSGE